MFFHFRAWVPRVLSENLWPQFEQSAHLESHLPAWWTDAASMYSRIPLPTTRYSLFRCFSKSITQGEGNTSCVFLCLYCLGFWVFLSTHVHPCQIFLQLYHMFPVRFLVTRDFPPLLISLLTTSKHGISLVTDGICLVTRVRSKKLTTT